MLDCKVPPRPRVSSCRRQRRPALQMCLDVVHNAAAVDTGPNDELCGTPHAAVEAPRGSFDHAVQMLFACLDDGNDGPFPTTVRPTAESYRHFLDYELTLFTSQHPRAGAILDAMPPDNALALYAYSAEKPFSLRAVIQKMVDPPLARRDAKTRRHIRPMLKLLAQAMDQIAALAADDTFPQTDVDAVQWVMARAARDDARPSAQCMVGCWHQEGLERTGLTADTKAAEVWFRRAAEGGDACSMMWIGTHVKDEGDMLKRAAEVPEATAQLIYSRKLVKERDPNASSWLKSSARLGSRTAMHTLGHLSAHGLGEFKRDVDAAVGWYVAAIRFGEEEARESLAALLCMEGKLRRRYAMKVDTDAVRLVRRVPSWLGIGNAVATGAAATFAPNSRGRIQ